MHLLLNKTTLIFFNFNFAIFSLLKNSIQDKSILLLSCNSAFSLSLLCNSNYCATMYAQERGAHCSGGGRETGLDRDKQEAWESFNLSKGKFVFNRTWIIPLNSWLTPLTVQIAKWEFQIWRIISSTTHILQKIKCILYKWPKQIYYFMWEKVQ